MNNLEVAARIEDAIPSDAVADPEPVVDYLYSVYIGARPRRGVRNFHQLYAGIEQLARTVSLDDIFEILESHLDL